MVAANVVDSAQNSVGQGLPRVLAAVVLLVIGLIAARILAVLVRRFLQAVGLDRAAEGWGVPAVLGRAGLPTSLAGVVAIAVRIAITATVIFAALSLLGLQFLSASLNAAVLFVPKLLLALALLLAGIVVASLVRERVDRASMQMDLPISLGVVAQIVIITIFAITAAAQVTISIALLMVLLAIVLAGAVATVALAFGLGGRDIARALGAGRYVRGAHPPGQQIRIGELRGTIERVEGTATVITTAAGETARVPNHMLIESVVIVEAPDAATGRA